MPIRHVSPKDTDMPESTADAVQLAIFAKAPIAGYAKTRLIPSLGPEGAAELQAYLIQRTIRTALTSPLRPTTLWCAPDCNHPIFRSARQEHGIATHVQVGDDLGERMFGAFDLLTPRSPVLLIGTDCPILSADYLTRCATALAGGADAAFIPAEDGGYALIGLRRPVWRLFEGIPWGTGDVMRLTRDRMREQNLSAFETEQLWDLDTPTDYDRAKSAALLSDPAA
jgi:rSAM/selenodomain-associated transferase 1